MKERFQVQRKRELESKMRKMKRQRLYKLLKQVQGVKLDKYIPKTKHFSRNMSRPKPQANNRSGISKNETFQKNFKIFDELATLFESCTLS